MNDDIFFSEIDKYTEKLLKCECITEKEVKILCEKAKELLVKEENVIFLDSPITDRKSVV